MKKKWYVSGLAMIVSLMLVLTACGGGGGSTGGNGGGNASTPSETGSDNTGSEPKSDEVYELNFNIATGPTHPYITELAQPWADYVNEQTEGRVKIHIFPNVALGPLNKTYQDLTGGVYDLGIIVSSYFQDTELFPMSIGDLPFGITEPRVANEVTTKFKEKYMEDVFGKGVTFLSTASTDGYKLITKKPVETVEDIKNMKINTNIPGVIDAMKQWGAVPVSIPNTDIYESLERGIIDGTVYTAVGSLSFKLFEIAPYLTNIDFSAASQTLGMSTASFERLPEDIRQMFLDDFGPRFAEKMVEMYTRMSVEAVETYGKEVASKDGRVIELSDEEMAKFHAAGKSFWDNWVEEANKRGYPGDQMMEDFKTWLKEAGAEVKF